MSDACSYAGRDSRLQIFRRTAETDNGSAESIALDFLCPCNCIMLQITAHWEAIPTTSEDISLWKDSVNGVKWDTVLRAVDPSAGEENVQDWVCVIPFFFAKGDHVRVDYANTDDQDIGVEIVLQQVSGNENP